MIIGLISVQLQLNLPTGTELGKIFRNRGQDGHSDFSMGELVPPMGARAG